MFFMWLLTFTFFERPVPRWSYFCCKKKKKKKINLNFQLRDSCTVVVSKRDCPGRTEFPSATGISPTPRVSVKMFVRYFVFIFFLHLLSQQRRRTCSRIGHGRVEKR